MRVALIFIFAAVAACDRAPATDAAHVLQVARAVG